MTRRFMPMTALLVFLTVSAAAQPAASPVLQAMKAELDRSLEKLKTQPVPPRLAPSNARFRILVRACV
jgi:hypothetical protein